MVPAPGGFTKRQTALVRDFGANGLACTPSYALTIAEELHETEYRVEGGSPRYGIFGAEPWPESLRTRLQETIGLIAVRARARPRVQSMRASCKEGWGDCW